MLTIRDLLPVPRQTFARRRSRRQRKGTIEIQSIPVACAGRARSNGGNAVSSLSLSLSLLFYSPRARTPLLFVLNRWKRKGNFAGGGRRERGWRIHFSPARPPLHGLALVCICSRIKDHPSNHPPDGPSAPAGAWEKRTGGSIHPPAVYPAVCSVAPYRTPDISIPRAPTLWEKLRQIQNSAKMETREPVISPSASLAPRLRRPVQIRSVH